MTCSNLDFAWASAITLRAVRYAFVRSASIALDTLGSRNEHREGNSMYTSAEDTNPSGPSVSLHALKDKLCRNLSLRDTFALFKVSCGFVFQIFAIGHH